MQMILHSARLPPRSRVRRATASAGRGAGSAGTDPLQINFIWRFQTSYIGMTLEGRSGPSNGRAQSRPGSRLEELPDSTRLALPPACFNPASGPADLNTSGGKPATYFDVYATAG